MHDKRPTEQQLDYEALLALSRKKVAAYVKGAGYPPGWEDMAARQVVREFLERICPIRVAEAYGHARWMSGDEHGQF